MKVTVVERPAWPTLSEFADNHGLEIEVVQRDHDFLPWGRYYAHFKHVDTCDDYPVLVGEHGNGETPEKAIEAYAEAIAGKRIKHWDWPRDRIVHCPRGWTPEDFSALVPRGPR